MDTTPHTMHMAQCNMLEGAFGGLDTTPHTMHMAQCNNIMLEGAFGGLD